MHKRVVSKGNMSTSYVSQPSLLVNLSGELISPAVLYALITNDETNETDETLSLGKLMNLVKLMYLAKLVDPVQ